MVRALWDIEMRLLTLTAVAVAMLAQAHAQAVHCRPDGAGGFVCSPERIAPPSPPPLTRERVKLIHQAIRSQIPDVPYMMTPDEMTDAERNGGTATNEERAAQPGSQFMVCEERLGRIGYGHADLTNACSGLSIHAPTKEQQATFDSKKAADFDAMLAEQRRQGEVLRDKIKAERDRAAAAKPDAH
jgi:hypothetical protein